MPGQNKVRIQDQDDVYRAQTQEMMKKELRKPAPTKKQAEADARRKK